VEFARRLSLDLDEFRREFAGQEVATKLEQDVRGGIRSGVNGTPTFFINGIRHDDSFEYPVLLAALQRNLAPRKRSTRAREMKGR
jgi:protein-disulfide isomerase